MKMEPISERDERLTKESQEAMPEAQQAMRRNGEVKLKVAINPEAEVVVKVTQQGQPHPKGIAAEIDHTVGPMTMSGEMVERVKNAAINHVRGQAHEFSVSEFDEREVQQKTGNETPATIPGADASSSAETGQHSEGMSAEQAEANRIAAAGGSDGLQSGDAKASG